MRFSNLVWSMAATVTIFILITAVFSYIFFLGPFGVSTDHQAWASFGGYFGGILGPVLSFANLLAIAWIATVVVSQQHEHISRKQLTIDMLTEYHSEPMHQTRIALDEWIEDIARNSGTLPPLSTLERTKDNHRINAFHLYHYFEKWAVLARTENIDNKLLIEALGGRVIWWQENFFQQIAASEKNHQILKSLREIDNYVFSKISPSNI